MDDACSWDVARRGSQERWNVAADREEVLEVWENA